VSTTYKAEIEAECLKRVLLPVLSAEHTFNCEDAVGIRRNVVAVLRSWASDLQEQWSLAGLIEHTGCALCVVALCLEHLVIW
jgi:hypothetical protein